MLSNKVPLPSWGFKKRVTNPQVEYTDGGYTSGEELVRFKSEGRELRGLVTLPMTWWRDPYSVGLMAYRSAMILALAADNCSTNNSMGNTPSSVLMKFPACASPALIRVSG